TGAALTADIKEKIRSEKLQLKKLNAELADLQTKLDKAKSSALKGAFNDPATPTKYAWGPLYFDIVDNCDPVDGTGKLTLRAVTWPDSTKQMKFEAYGDEPASGARGSSTQLKVVGSSKFEVVFAGNE